MKSFKLVPLIVLLAALCGSSCVIAVGNGSDRDEPTCCEAADRLNIECPECEVHAAGSHDGMQCCDDAESMGVECALCQEG